MPGPRVLVVHNRYRVEGGEERSVDLQLRALRGAGVEHALFERRSAGVGRVRAAAALLRGGAGESELVEAVATLGAGVVHAHNMLPMIGPRGLAAARHAGARVVLHLHNLRLFCAIGVASRDGGPCFRCRGRLTLPGVVLNCRGSLPESAAYAAGLAAHQPLVLDAVHRFVAPSRWAAGQLARHGLPAERLEVLPHYIPEESFATRSSAAEGGYALVAARLSEEKGIDIAIQASAAAGVPLRIAGEGPHEAALRELAGASRAPVEFLGRADRGLMAELLAGAGALVMPSRYHEFAPYAALEAMAAGVPVVASRLGGLPELIEPSRCVPPNDAGALARRLRALWDDPELRRSEGDALLARARVNHSEAEYVERLLALYAA
ncbi:MAG TPA: glycosyltransferase family 4 protein [Thermoleophilaceae bacterium]|nr:glycosyltransferase family 4 protein [Thermoleophilaceae bacterium]